MEPYAGTTCFISYGSLPEIHLKSSCSDIDNQDDQQSLCQVMRNLEILLNILDNITGRLNNLIYFFLRSIFAVSYAVATLPH
jgi:hypothetical protein